MSDLISIIIPMYNSEKTLNRCIESVLKQTYSNIEVVLINDGSTDNSRNICEEFAKKDNRIVLVNKENEGVGKARNTGLEVSNGKYISFVDSDDYIESNMIENLYNILISHNVDCVKANYDIVTKNGIEKNNEIIIDSIYEQENIESFVYELLRERVKSFLWLLLIKKECIKDKFSEELFLYEDVNFYLSILGNIKSLCVTSKIMYHYVITENSLSRDTNKIDLNINELIKANKIIKQTLRKYNFDNIKNIEAFDTSIINNIINYCYYKFKISKNLKDIIKYFEKLKEEADVSVILKNYNDVNLSKKARIYNDSLINKKYFKFWILSKIKNILAIIKRR